MVKLSKKKRCSKCGTEKEMDNFYKQTDKRYKTDVRSWCKKCFLKYSNETTKKWRKNNPEEYSLCQRKQRLRKYWPNMSGEEAIKEYNKIFVSQRGKCAACGSHQNKLTRALAVDHDHKTNKIRGLLCMNCNRALGYSKDDIFVLKALVNYLRKHRRNK